MPEERDFLQQCFAVVNRRLENEGSLERVACMQLQRDRRLLGKMLAELPDGRVLETLQMWRGTFNSAWLAHRQQRRKLLADDRRARASEEALSSGGEVCPGTAIACLGDAFIIGAASRYPRTLRRWDGCMRWIMERK